MYIICIKYIYICMLYFVVVTYHARYTILNSKPQINARMISKFVVVVVARMVCFLLFRLRLAASLTRRSLSLSLARSIIVAAALFVFLSLLLAVLHRGDILCSFALSLSLLYSPNTQHFCIAKNNNNNIKKKKEKNDKEMLQTRRRRRRRRNKTVMMRRRARVRSETHK